MASEEVGYHPYNSSAQALPELVETICGMTGTPWNYDGFSKKFGELIVDQGAEGQIAQVLRQSQNAIHIDSIQERPNQNLSIKDLLKQAQVFPDVILDMGAFFKHQSIEASARTFLKEAENRRGSNKKGVLFFHHQKGETTSDRIALGQFVEGTWTITFLENTRASALKKEGFNPEDCVTFLDQRHTTGTDLSLPLNARGLITANENVETRTLLQTVMRQTFLLKSISRFCSYAPPILYMLKKRKRLCCH